jgi:hypothetical protein
MGEVSFSLLPPVKASSAVRGGLRLPIYIVVIARS